MVDQRLRHHLLQEKHLRHNKSPSQNLRGNHLMVGAHRTAKVSTQQHSVYVEPGLLPGHFQPQASSAKNPLWWTHLTTTLLQVRSISLTHTHTHLCPSAVFVWLTTCTNTLILQPCISDGVSQNPHEKFITFTVSDAAPHSLPPIPFCYIKIVLQKELGLQFSHRRKKSPLCQLLSLQQGRYHILMCSSKCPIALVYITACKIIVTVCAGRITYPGWQVVSRERVREGESGGVRQNESQREAGWKKLCFIVSSTR